MNKTVPTILLLGFLVVVEVMLAKAASNAHHTGMAFGAGGAVGFKMGGGGFHGGGGGFHGGGGHR
jgi:hypothetical protein